MCLCQSRPKGVGGSRREQRKRTTHHPSSHSPLQPVLLSLLTFPRHGESHSLTLVTHVTGWGKVESDMKDKTRVVPLAFPAFEWHLRENHGAPHASRASYRSLGPHHSTLIPSLSAFVRFTHVHDGRNDRMNGRDVLGSLLISTMHRQFPRPRDTFMNPTRPGPLRSSRHFVSLTYGRCKKRPLPSVASGAFPRW